MGYDVADWSDFFVCAGGAAAALSGLIFVGLSINLAAVLEIDRKEGHNFLTGRALEALTALLLVLTVSLVALSPAIAPGVLGGVIVLLGLVSVISPARALRSSRGQSKLSGATLTRVVTAFLFTGCLVTSGVTLLVGSGGGLSWLTPAFVPAVVVAGVNAWVLLVEVLR